MILVDAGPLVAVLRRDDQHHTSCLRALRAIQEPMATVWPVVSEAMHLLRRWPNGHDLLWQRLADGSPRLLPLDAEDIPTMRDLMLKYRDRPMDLADAALVRVAERERIFTIFTVDRSDFAVYRPLGRRFRILP